MWPQFVLRVAALVFSHTCGVVQVTNPDRQLAVREGDKVFLLSR